MSTYNISKIDKAGLYEVLASSYIQLPTTDNIKQVYIALKEAEEVFKEIDLSKLIIEAKDRMDKIKDDPEKIKDLEQDYYDHFLVPITSYYIPPYESSLKGAIKVAPGQGRKNKGGWRYNQYPGELGYNVKMAYESVGFDPKDLNIIQELKHEKKMEHLGFELAFMAYLSISEYESEEEVAYKWNGLQTQFLKEHLLEFVNNYWEISKEKAKPFYKALSEVIKDYVNWDLGSR